MTIGRNLLYSISITDRYIVHLSGTSKGIHISNTLFKQSNTYCQWYYCIILFATSIKLGTISRIQCFHFVCNFKLKRHTIFPRRKNICLPPTPSYGVLVRPSISILTPSYIPIATDCINRWGICRSKAGQTLSEKEWRIKGRRWKTINDRSIVRGRMKKRRSEKENKKWSM